MNLNIQEFESRQKGEKFFHRIHHTDVPPTLSSGLEH